MSERKSNFELLRIFLMYLIIVGHLLMASEKLGSVGTKDYYITNIIRSFVMYSVNAFVLLSGYFGIKLKVKKLLYFDVKIVFYTLGIFCLALLFGIHTINPIKDVQLLFPVLTKQYWFITIYFVLCFLSPFLNKFLKNITKKDLERILIGGFVIFYVIATFCFAINANQVVDDAGYGVVNFVYLYMLGFYLREYYEDKRGTKFYLVIFAVNSLALFWANHVMSKVLGFYFNSFISYNTVFVLLGAVALFMSAKGLNIKNSKIINKIASRCLFVYILHMHPTVWKFVMQEIFKINELTGIKLIVGVLIYPVIIYAVCAIIDVLVDLLFKPISNLIQKSKFIPQ